MKRPSYTTCSYVLSAIISTLSCSLFGQAPTPTLQVPKLSWTKLREEAIAKTLPFTQPIPISFGGAQYISSSHGQKIHRGGIVHHLQRGYLEDMVFDATNNSLKILKSQLYNIDYFLSVKLVIDTSQTVNQIMTLKVNGHEIGQFTLSIVSSTTFIPNTTLVTAIYNGTASLSIYLQRSDKVQLALSKQSTKPHWGTKKVHVFAEGEDLAASLFIESQATALS